MPTNISEDIILESELTDHIVKLLHGDYFWHEKIRRVLTDAGFAIGSLFRDDIHPIWQASITRRTFDLAPDIRTANKQIRKVLANGGIKIVRGEFTIIDRRGDKLRCVFMLDLGAPGFLDIKHEPIASRRRRNRSH